MQQIKQGSINTFMTPISILCTHKYTNNGWGIMLDEFSQVRTISVADNIMDYATSQHSLGVILMAVIYYEYHISVGRLLPARIRHGMCGRHFCWGSTQIFSSHFTKWDQSYNRFFLSFFHFVQVFDMFSSVFGKKICRYDAHPIQLFHILFITACLC